MKMRMISALAATIGGVVISPLSASNVAGAQTVAAAQNTDTATVRLHITGMTCGTCPLTARKALDKLDGVYSSTVTYTDSLGVVKFDPRKVKPAEIASHLTKMTGYGAKVLPDSIKIRKS